MVSQDQLLKSLVPVLLLACIGACSLERWPVKTGTDDDRGLVDLSRSTATTIGALRALPAPEKMREDNRVRPTETTQFVVSARLKEYKLATDSDYHLVLVDDSGQTMIAEIPDPEWVGPHSPFAAGIQTAREEFDKKYEALYFFRSADIPVCVKGIGFFDFDHGQRGKAPNGIELHPVLDIQFNPTSCAAKP